jgi:Arc/MetJ family transcription regulator
VTPAGRRRFDCLNLGYTVTFLYILSAVTKHLVDIDDDTLGAARAELGTATLRDTVNEALRLAASSRDQRVSRALDALAGADLGDREAAWR